MQPERPTRPWEKLGTDIFEFNGSKYLMTVDYYSRFPIVRPLSNAPINVNPVGGGGGVRARAGDLMPETIPLSGF